MSALVVAILRSVLRAYQLVLSPLIGPACRFAPSCSEYAREALAVHGPARGLWLAARRVGRCHPWNAGGHDPVPPPVRATPHGAAPSAGPRAQRARSHA